MPKRKTSSAVCQVCGGPNAFKHYGAIACRACGEFFKRVAVSEKEFPCKCGGAPLRGGDGTAAGADMGEYGADDMTARILQCKGCRKKRCIEAGMRGELVKSVNLAAFRCERKKMMERKNGGVQPLKMVNNSEAQPMVQGSMNLNCAIHSNNNMAHLLRHFAELESRMRRIYLSATGHDHDHFADIHTVDRLFEPSRNLLNNWMDFSLELSPCRDAMDILKYGVPKSVSRPYLLITDFAKTLPIFGRLQRADQLNLLCASIESMSALMICHCALLLGSTTSMYDGMCAVFTRARAFAGDRTLQKLAKRVFSTPMERFHQVRPGNEELILLMALAFVNSANSSSLSKQGQKAVREEEEQYGRLLLQFEQHRHGQAGGAQRYLQMLQLLWSTIGDGQRLEEFGAYMGSLYQLGTNRIGMGSEQRQQRGKQQQREAIVSIISRQENFDAILDFVKI